MHVPQNTFERTGLDLVIEIQSLRVKKKLAKEIVVVADDEDEEEGRKEEKVNSPTSHWPRRSYSTRQGLM